MLQITQTIFLNPTDSPSPIPDEYCLVSSRDSLAKFIVTADGALVIGPMRHGLLAALYFKNSLLATDVRQALREAERKYRDEILSAGAIAKNGTISWGSTGFGITESPGDQLFQFDIEQKINDFLQKNKT